MPDVPPPHAKRIVIGTAGHIDHGKSRLVLALTGIDPDRLKEEKERGITIELGFAHLALPSGTVAGIVDVPGHEKFVRAMVAGAAGIDVVMLVVAADEGVKPQTREHLDICRLLAIRDGIVVLTKCDLAEADWIDLQEEEVRALVRGSFLEGAPVVRVSAATGEGLPRLVEELDRIAARIPGKDPSRLFRLPVDRSFTMKGFGTVVTGTIVGGTIRVGEEVVALPGGAAARVRGIQVHGGPAESSAAGTRTAVNLQGIEREAVPRGSVLCRPGTFAPTAALDVYFEYLPQAPQPLKARARVSFHAGTAVCLGKVLPYGAAAIAPGESGYARVELDEPTVASGGDPFILRGFSPLPNFGYTIGGGRILHPWSPPRKGIGRVVPPELVQLSSAESGLRVAASLEISGTGGLSDVEAAAIAGIAPEEAKRRLEGLARSAAARRDAATGRFFPRKALEEVRRAAVAALSALHDRSPERNGFPREEIAALLPSPQAASLLPLALEGAAEVGRAGDLLFLPARRPREIELSSPLARSVAAVLEKAGLQAPGIAELRSAVRPGDDAEFEKTVDGMVRAGAVVRVKELYFDPKAVAGLKGRLVAFLEEKKEITVPEFKELSGLTRKYLIPLLEHFDAAKVTLRVGDKRVLRKGR